MVSEEQRRADIQDGATPREPDQGKGSHIIMAYSWSRYAGVAVGVFSILAISAFAGVRKDVNAAILAAVLLGTIAMVINVPRIVAEMNAPRELELSANRLTARWRGQSRTATLASLRIREPMMVDRWTIPPSIIVETEGWHFRVFKDIEHFENLEAILVDSRKEGR